MAEAPKKDGLTKCAEVITIIAGLLGIPIGLAFWLPTPGANRPADKNSSPSEIAQERPASPILALKPPILDQENKKEEQQPKKEPPPDNIQRRLPTVAEIESRLYSFTCPHCREMTQKTAKWIVEHKKLELPCGYDWNRGDFHSIRDGIREELDQAKRRR